MDPVKLVVVMASRTGATVATSIDELMEQTLARSDGTVQWARPKRPVLCEFANDQGRCRLRNTAQQHLKGRCKSYWCYRQGYRTRCKERNGTRHCASSNTDRDRDCSSSAISLARKCCIGCNTKVCRHYWPDRLGEAHGTRRRPRLFPPYQWQTPKSGQARGCRIRCHACPEVGCGRVNPHLDDLSPEEHANMASNNSVGNSVGNSVDNSSGDPVDNSSFEAMRSGWCFQKSNGIMPYGMVDSISDGISDFFLFFF